MGHAPEHKSLLSSGNVFQASHAPPPASLSPNHTTGAHPAPTGRYPLSFSAVMVLALFFHPSAAKHSMGSGNRAEAVAGTLKPTRPYVQF
jgi:hypothetical protein